MSFDCKTPAEEAKTGRRTERIDYHGGGWALIEYRGKKRHGLWTVYRANGAKDWERQCADDKTHGFERKWHEDGQLIDEKWFQKGELHGVWRRWYPSGQIEHEAHFVDGHQEGFRLGGTSPVASSLGGQ